jgi:hypothetical protein
MVPPKQIDKVYFNTICCLGLSLSLFLQHHVVSTEEFESQGPGDVFFSIDWIANAARWVPEMAELQPSDGSVRTRYLPERPLMRKRLSSWHFTLKLMMGHPSHGGLGVLIEMLG